MKKIWLTLLGGMLLIFGIQKSMAQSSQRETVTLEFIASREVQTVGGILPFTGEQPFFAYFLTWQGETHTASIRFSTDGRDWGTWIDLPRDEHNEDRGVSILQFGLPAFRYYELRWQAPTKEEATLHFFQPGVSTTVADEATGATDETAGCICPQPAFQNRNDWCPSGNCPEHPSPSLTSVTHLIVHHAAGTNVANDWAAVVRAIWDYHVNGNQWSDIGYNWLVDPNGVIYEGRGDNILGAHFCAQNTGTMGVCVLGDFTNITPTNEAINALQSLLAWKSCDIGADPQGSAFHGSSGLTLPIVSGHRDGCNTACPGCFLSIISQCQKRRRRLHRHSMRCRGCTISFLTRSCTHTATQPRSRCPSNNF
ncbi:MAG: N-acetylmuramoyl-L-alanine amidase [Saprospiraceae bacterium]